MVCSEDPDGVIRKFRSEGLACAVLGRSRLNVSETLAQTARQRGEEAFLKKQATESYSSANKDDYKNETSQVRRVRCILNVHPVSPTGGPMQWAGSL